MGWVGFCKSSELSQLASSIATVKMPHFSIQWLTFLHKRPSGLVILIGIIIYQLRK